MLRYKGPRRQVFHGGSRSAQVIEVAATNAKIKKAKRLERAQVGYQLKYLRAKAFTHLPQRLKTPELRKALYDLTNIDQEQAIPTPTTTGPQLVKNNIIRTIYHDGMDMKFDKDKFSLIKHHIPPQLATAILAFEDRYRVLSHEIRSEQMPHVPAFPRPIIGHNGADLLPVNEQFKPNLGDDQERAQVAQQINKLSPKGRQHVENLSSLYSKLAQAEEDGESDDVRKAILAKIEQVPFDSSELAALIIPAGMKPTAALTARVFNMCAHPIDYLDLYRAVFRGKQSVMSQKLMKELQVMQYAVDNLTDAEFIHANPHRAAVMAWKLMNSDDLDESTVTTALRYLDRMGDRTTPTLIHHNPEIMADSWIVEAFNNRNNPNYSVELLKGAKAADSDLSRFKLFLHDTELVPRRLAVFLGLHYVKTKRTLPAHAIQPFFHALNYCRYPGQVNTLLNAIVTAAPDLVVPPQGIYEAMVAAHKIGEIDSVEQLSSYIRSSTGIGRGKVLPMNYRVGSVYIDALQSRAISEFKQLDMDIRSETTAVLKDMIARGEVPDVFSHDMIDAFLIPEPDAAHGSTPVDVLPLVGGNTDPRFALASPHNISQHESNFAQLRQKQHLQDATLSSKLKTFNINVQSHVLPHVAFTALNYALRSLHEMGNQEGLVFRKPVRLYISNMKSVYESFNATTLATDRNNSAGSIEQINQDLEGQPLRPVDPQTGKMEPFGMADLSKLPQDASNNFLMPNPASDLNVEYRNLTRVLDATEVFQDMADEKATPMNPHVAHLIEQCIPSLAYNPHIYDDVLDIIHIKTGLSPHGQEGIGGGSGLRNPDKIDEYLAREVEQFVQAFGLVVTKNVRFGYYEISVDEMNNFLTRDVNKMFENYTLVTEKFLQAQEENDKLVYEAKSINLGSPEESGDEIGIRASLLESDIPSHIIRNQLHRDRKYNTPTGIPYDDKTLLYKDIMGQHETGPARQRLGKLEMLTHGLNVPDIPTPDSLNITMPKVRFVPPAEEQKGKLVGYTAPTETKY